MYGEGEGEAEADGIRCGCIKGWSLEYQRRSFKLEVVDVCSGEFCSYSTNLQESQHFLSSPYSGSI